MFKKLFKTSFAICIIVTIILMTACNTKTVDAPGTKSVDQSGKYNPPITLTACRFIGPQVKYAEGESIENNIWTRAYEEKLGIKLKYAFTSPDFQTFDVKVNMAIASDSLPDILPLYTTLFFRAVNSGRLADITGVFNEYALPRIKEQMSEMADGIAYKSASKDGKLYALAIPPELHYNVPMLWIRKDWLGKLGLEPPQNTDDVIRIAQAFTNNDPDGDGEKDTFGLAVDKELGGIDGFLNGYHAYRKIWMEKDGKLERGEIQPEMKAALSKLADLYKAGAIDEEFVLKSSEDLKQDYGAEVLGMVYGTYTSPDGTISQAVKSNTNADWEAYAIPSCDEKPALGQVDGRIGGFMSINAKCKYPEALIKLMNLWSDITARNEPEYSAYHDKDGIDTFWYPIVSGLGGPSDFNLMTHDKIEEVLKSGDVTKLNAEQKGYYDRIKTWIDQKNPEGWGMYMIFGPGSPVGLIKATRDNKRYYNNKGWGPETPAWVENGPNLAYKELEYFSNIIIGEYPIDEFDNWVEYFNENGGTKATAEINEWYQKNK